MFQFWFGTEDSLMALIETEKMAHENFVSLMGQRKAFFDDMDDEAGARKGAYLLENSGGTGVIKVNGSLTNGYRWYHEMMDGRVTSYEAISDAIDLALEDPAIDNIVLSIQSGGGAVTGIDALGEKIRRADQIKPIKAHTQTAAYSAAYWLASSTREVLATRMAEVGSIGAMMVHTSLARMAQEKGIDVTIFRAGKYKAIGHPMEELTEEAKAYLQNDVEKANMFFLEHVSRRRNLLMSDKGRWAEGKTFFAGEAIDVGLVDRIASLEDVLRASSAQTHGRYRMLISEEKRAQIAAGARPEDVLTAEELTAYQAEVPSDESTSSSEDTIEAKHARIAAGEKAEDVLTAEELKDWQAANPDTSTTVPEGLQAEYNQLLKDNGKLEARLEAAEANLAAGQERLATAQAQIASLQEVGKLAVNNLQVALGLPKESPGTPEGLVSAYNELQGKMAARFNTGQLSKSPDPTKVDNNSVVPLAFRQRAK